MASPTSPERRAQLLDPERNPFPRATDSATIRALANMSVGEHAFLDEITAPHMLSAYRKRRAAMVMDCPGARWKARTTTKGVRITRVA